jgi:hypothetical protein
VPAVADYDLYLYRWGDCADFVAKSDKYGSGVAEHIEYTPAQVGRYYIRVHPYEGGHSDAQPYVLVVRYDYGCPLE